MDQKPSSANLSDKKQIIENEERYRALYENAPLPYQSLNEDGSFRDVNPAWLRTLGYSRDEVIGKFYRDFLHPDWQAHFDINFPAFKKKGYVNDVQFKIRHKNGEYRDISFEGCIGYNPDGSFRQTYCVFQDITERKMAEQELNLNKKKYENLFNSIQDSILVANTERKIIQCNPAFTDLFGYHENEIIGKDTAYVYKSLDGFKEMGEKIKENVQNSNFLLTVQFKKKNGTFFSGETNVYYLKDENEEIKGFIALIRDVTESEKAKAALKESEERWQFALEGAGDGVWDWDLQTNKVFFSDQWKKMLGYQPNEIPNEFEEWKKRVHPDDLEKALEDVDKHVRGETQLYKNEQRLLCKDGTYKWILDRGKVLSRDTEGKPIRMIGIHTDINERKQAEFELKKIQFGIDNTQMGIYQVEENGLISYANKYALQNLGYSKEELVGMSLFKIAPYFNTDDFVKHRKKSKEMGKNTIISVHKRKDGSEFPIEVTTTYFNYGEKALSFSFVTDITERKKAEEEIEQNRRTLQLFIDYAPAAIAMYDREMKYLSVSKRFLSDYELGDTNVIGKSHYEVFPEIPERWKEIHRRCLNGETAQCDDDPFLRANGKLDRIRWKIRPWVQSQDEIGGIILFSEVITEQKIANEKLKESEEKYRLVLDNSLDAIILSGPDGSIYSANKAACEMFQMTEKEICKNGRKGLLDLDDTRLPGFLEERKRTGKVKGELNFIRKDKSIFPGEVTTSLFKDKNGELRTSMIIRDISERIKSENKLKELKDRLQTEVLEKTKELKDRIAELERFNEATIEREFRMKELRDEIERLKKQNIK